MSAAHSTPRGVVLALLVSVLTTVAGIPRVASAGEALIVLTHRADQAAVRVVAGETVRFRNDDDERHRMRAREPESVDTSDIAPGAQVAVALDVPGTYTFIDERTDDPAYEVVVTVRDRSTTETDAPAGGSGGPAADDRDAGEPTSGSPPRQAAPSSATVTIPDRRFSPTSITIAAGGTVTWENQDDDHTVTADDGSFDSGVFDAGGRFERTFPAAGDYAYHCVLHPEMTGVVSVTGAAGSSPTPPGSSPPRDDTPDTDAGGADDAPAEQGPASATRSAAGGTDIAIQDFEFSPATSRVPVGTTVTWTNLGEAPHTVTSRGSGPLDSGLIAAGGTFGSTFRDAGTYDYFCEFHPGMTARIVAVDGAGQPTGDGAPSSGSPAGSGTGSDTGRPGAPEAGTTDQGTPATSSSGASARDGAALGAAATAPDGRHAAGMTFVAALVAAFAAGRASATRRTATSIPRRPR